MRQVSMDVFHFHSRIGETAEWLFFIIKHFVDFAVKH